MGRPAKVHGEAKRAVKERLNALLDAHGWSVEDVARKINVTVPRIKHLLLQNEEPEPYEYGRIVALRQQNGA